MEKLLELKEISKRFSLGNGRYSCALDRVNLSVYRGETLGILGESGCGKSTLARVIMGVYPPTDGKILFLNQRLTLRRRQERQAFARHAQMIFQDPYLSLDPHMTVKDIITENLEIHGMGNKDAQMHRMHELLDVTGLLREHAQRFPHEFSGGQQQRIGIARALAIQPDFLVCDEPVSALDRATRGQILDLLIQLKAELGLTYLFISHDVNIVQRISDRIAVMYMGAIMELGTAEDICESPLHPYTKMLLRSRLPSSPDPSWLENEKFVHDEIPNLTGSISGCRFAERCSFATKQCHNTSPILSPVHSGHSVACWQQNQEKT